MIVLKSFSQDVDLSMSTEAKYLNYLVFTDHDGSEFRLPVPQETIQALIKRSKPKTAEAQPPVEEDEAGAIPSEELGEDNPVPEDEEQVEEDEPEEIPQSEDDVESM